MIQFIENNILFWMAQVLVVGTVGALLLLLASFRHARSELTYTHTVMAILLVLPFLQPWETNSPTEIAASVGVQAVAVEDGEWSLARAGIRWDRVSLGVLVVGMAGRLLWIGAGLVRVRAYRRSGIPVFPHPEAIRRATRLTGGTATFLVSSDVESPVTVGCGPSAVLLPEGFHDLDFASQFAIACHELVHVRRLDWITTLAEELALVLFWFHPAAWWLVARARLSRELLVDTEVVHITGDRESYVMTLLGMARRSSERRGLSPVATFAHPRHLTTRVRQLLQEVQMPRFRVFLSYSAIALGLLMAISMAVSGFPLAGNPERTRVAPLPEPQSTTEGFALAPNPARTASTEPGPQDADTGFVVRRQIAVPADQLDPSVSNEVVVLLTFNADGNIVNSRVVSGPDQMRQLALQSALMGGNNYNVTSARELQVVLEFMEGPATTQAAMAPLVVPENAVRISAGVQRGNLVRQVQPVYPTMARTARIEGTVILETVVDSDGRVIGTRVVRGHPMLNPAAQDAVEQWVYQPLMLNGEAVPVVSTVTIDFSLQ